MKMAPTGNVFRDPDSGKILNPENVIHRNTNRTTTWNDPNAPAGAAVVEGAPTVSETGEQDEDGRPVTSEGENLATERDVLASVVDLVQEAKQGNRAAKGSLESIARMERARPNGGRPAVLRQLQRAGV